MHVPSVGQLSAGQHTKRQPPIAGWRFVLTAAVLAVAATAVLRATVMDVYLIPSSSMQPLLAEGDRVLVNRLGTQSGDIQRGDVVVFDGRGSFAPFADGRTIPEQAGAQIGSWLGLSGSDSIYIKRVIGVAGDRVGCCSDTGTLTLNGTAFDEPYVYGSDAPSKSAFDVVVPDGRLWLMGDHRSVSVDSRALLGAPGGGLVPVDRIIGRAVQLLWPLSRFQPVESSTETYPAAATPDLP